MTQIADCLSLAGKIMLFQITTAPSPHLPTTPRSVTRGATTAHKTKTKTLLGSLRRSPRLHSWMGRGILPPHTPYLSPRRLRRLGLDAFSVSVLFSSFWLITVNFDVLM